MTVGLKRLAVAATLGTTLWAAGLSWAETKTAATTTANPNQVTANAVARKLQTVPGLRLNISAQKGVVTLVGTAANAQARDKAVEAAKQVVGNGKIKDQIVVSKVHNDKSIRRTNGDYYPAAPEPGHFDPVMMGGYPGGPAPIDHDGGYIPGGMPHDGGYMPGGMPHDGGYVSDGGPAPLGPAQLSGYGVAAGAPRPNYAWPSHAPYPNYSAVGYPTSYPWQAWPNIGPFYPYPEVPLDWRAVTLRWDDGIWWLDFKKHYTRPFFVPYPFGLKAY